MVRSFLLELETNRELPVGATARSCSRSLCLKSIALIVVFCFLSTPTHAQIRIHRTVTVDDGLVQSQVNSILEDRDGFLWLGTFGGLSRWDGARFTNFQTQDGLLGPDVRVIRQAPDGRVFIGTDQGINIWNGQELDPEMSVRGLANDNIRDILFTPDGRVWVATGNGLVVFTDAETLESPAAYLLKDTSISSLDADIAGTVYVSTFGRRIFRVDGVDPGALDPGERLPSALIRDVLIDSTGMLWISVAGNGIWTMSDEGLGPWAYNAALEGHDVKLLSEGTDGGIWLGTVGTGVYHLQDGRLDHITKAQGLGDDTVWGIAEGRDGSVFFGTWGGLSVLDRRRTITLNRDTGLVQDLVTSITGLPGGGMVFGSYGSGFTVLQDGVAQTVDRSQGLADGRVWSLLGLDDGSLLVGTHTGAYSWREGKLTLLFGEDDRLLGRIYTIEAMTDGAILFGTYDGVVLNTGDGPRLLYEDPDPKRRVIHDILAEPDGGAIIATGKGIVRWKNETAEFLSEDHVLHGLSLWAVHRTASGALVYGANGHGVFIEDEHGVRQFTVADGMTDNTIYGILEDATGRLYLSTHRGINVLDPESDPPTFRHLGTNAGLASEECNQGASWRDPEGGLWFGTIKGASRIDPERDLPRGSPPRAHLRRIRLFDEPLSLDGLANRPRFAHHQNYFKFDFVGIQLTDPQEVRYRYRMSRIDRDWVISDQDFVQYTALPPGTYSFEVQAGDEWSRWSESAAVEFTIQPPFWRTWWFTILIALLLGGGAALIVMYRVRQLVAIERLRTSIAADLHDDIGAGLTEISIRGEVVRKKVGSASEVDEELARIGEMARGLIVSMSDIIWLVRPTDDSFGDLLIRLLDQYRSLFQVSGAHLEIDLDPVVRHKRLSVDERHHLLLFCKEALNNCLKYSGADTVTVVAGKRDGSIVFEIKDDGRGFESNTSGGGRGLKNMQMRADSLGGKLNIQSSSGAGTVIMLDW